MIIIGILLTLLGIAALWMSSFAFGDIGVALAISGVVSILSGIGFIATSRKMKNNP